MLGAVVCATLFILPFRVATQGGRGAGAALGLLFFVGLIFFPWAVRRFRRSSDEKRRATFSLAWKVALAAAFGNIAQGWAFETLHSGVAATFIQLNVLFVAVLGVFWLDEPLRATTVLGIALALLGIGVTQWPALAGQFESSWGIIWAVLAALGFSCIDLLSRRDSSGVDVVVTNVARSWMAALMLAFVPGALRQFFGMSPAEIGACAVASILGPGMARQLLLSASRELPAAESALLQQLRPPLAIPLASAVFGIWPTKWEWWGSVLVGAGVVLPFLIVMFSRGTADRTRETE